MSETEPEVIRILRLRDAVKAMRDDAQAVFQNHHCLVCANGSPCNALVLLNRIQATAFYALDLDAQTNPNEVPHE
jgi:hypothetical protein